MTIYANLKDFFLERFHERGEEIIPFLCESSVSKEVFNHYYQKLPPIEELSEKEKQEMKEYVIALFPNKTIEEKVAAAKIIYTVGSLI